MIADQVRLNGYLRAIEKFVKPNSCVVDLGTGSGIFALAAAKLGARRVYAIEPDDIIGLAIQLARDNDLSDRIVFIQADAREVKLEEGADLIISDLGGHVPWHGNHFTVLHHARTHFLAPDGIIIPRVDRVFAAIVADKEPDRCAVWHDAPLGLDLNSAAEAASNELGDHVYEPGDLLSEPVPVITVDYQREQEPNLERELEIHINREGKACGLALWFDRELADGIRVDNGPEAGARRGVRRIYRHVQFPWPSIVSVTPGDYVRVNLVATHSVEGYEWSWDSLIRKSEGGKLQGLRYRQSTAISTPSEDSNAATGLSPDGKVLKLCLSLMRAGERNEGIAEALMHGFPARFPRRDSALAYVSALCREFA